jgi:Protein of unknown function (DUF4197)
MRSIFHISIAVLLISSSCAEVMSVIQTPGPVPLSREEVVSGLKEALVTGAKNAAGKLSAENGYFGDETIKILLPEDAKMITDNISKLPGGENMLKDVVLRINRAAEDAAKEAAPVFANSVKQLTINDAFNILDGPDNAATLYLRQTTYTELYSIYKPKIAVSTEKKIGPVSAKESWIALTGKWNLLANSVAGKLANLKPVNSDLDAYLTGKALDGMFLKVTIEEGRIRKNVSARVTPLLQRVFGSLDNKSK